LSVVKTNVLYMREKKNIVKKETERREREGQLRSR
jgi:hypothetical protein